MDTPPQFEPLLDAESVGHLLQFHRRTVLKLARLGALPAVRYGRIWRFRRKDIDSWIEARISALRPPHASA